MPRTLPSGSIILGSCCKPRSAAGTIVGKGFWSVLSSNLVKTQDKIHPNEHWGNGEINTGEINMQGVAFQILFS